MATIPKGHEVVKHLQAATEHHHKIRLTAAERAAQHRAELDAAAREAAAAATAATP